MAETEDQEFDESFKGFGDDPTPVTPPVADPATPPATPPAPAEPPKADPKPAEEPKKDDTTPPAEPPKKGEEATPPADDEKKPEEGAEPPKAPETPPAPEEPKPLTKDDVTSIIRDIRTEERTSGQALEETTKEVMEAYYPDGLSNVLTDSATGKELKTPQDVVDVTNGAMTIEEAAQWLMNEQFKLDQQIDTIRKDARAVAETTLKFKQDGVDVLQRYEPIFKAYPQIQEKVWNQYIKLVKADKEKGVILSAPDMREFYDTVLEPYRLAFEYQSGQSGTAPTPPPAGTPGEPAPPAAPGADDRLDEGGDGGVTAPNDPNDFAQQVSKELAKGI